MKRILYNKNLHTTISSKGRSSWVMLLPLVAICCFTNCNRDMERIDAKYPESFKLSLPSEMITLIRGVGGTDTIKPDIIIPDYAEKHVDTSAFSYLWTLLLSGDTLSTRPYLTYLDFEKQPLAFTSCLLAVKEKSTGITRHAAAQIFMTTASREGWVILGEKAGKSSIGMLSFSSQGYRKYIDVSTDLGKPLTLSGKPISINTLASDRGFILGVNQYIGVVTDQEVKVIRTMDFEVNQNASNLVTQLLKPSTSSPVYFDVNGSFTFTANRNDDAYMIETRAMATLGVVKSYPLNRYYLDDNTIKPFKASPRHAIMGGMVSTFASDRMMFDEDSGAFVRVVVPELDEWGNFTSAINLQLGFSLKGYKLKAIHTRMKNQTLDYSSITEDPDEFTTLVHNPTTKETYLIQFLANGVLVKANKIPFEHAKAIVESQFIELDINTGYVIYAKGNEVLAYDYLIGQTINLLHFNQESISVLKMENHIPITKVFGRSALYEQLVRKLVVCTYDPADPDNTGTFRMYRILLGHQLPVLETEEKGFPKIIDVSFVPIP